MKLVANQCPHTFTQSYSSYLVNSFDSRVILQQEKLTFVLLTIGVHGLTFMVFSENWKVLTLPGPWTLSSKSCPMATTF